MNFEGKLKALSSEARKFQPTLSKALLRFILSAILGEALSRWKLLKRLAHLELKGEATPFHENNHELIINFSVDGNDLSWARWVVSFTLEKKIMF